MPFGVTVRFMPDWQRLMGRRAGGLIDKEMLQQIVTALYVLLVAQRGH